MSSNMLSVSILSAVLLALFTVPNSEACGDREVQTCPAKEKEDWSYRGKNGPNHWKETFPKCAGKKQSPINIETKKAVKDETLQKLALQGVDKPVTKATLENTGREIKVRIQDLFPRTITADGAEYRLQELNFHFGIFFSDGTEHALNGVKRAMEMHVVYMKGNNYTVVAVQFKEGVKDNKELQKIVDQLPDVKYKGDEVPLKTSLTLKNLLPPMPTSYYRYFGSSTEPPCSEEIIWLVIPFTVDVGTAQMLKFRELESTTKEDTTPGCKLYCNFRPLQDLNGRIVRLSQ